MPPFHCIRCRAEIDREFKACPHCGEPVTEFLRRYAAEPIDGKYTIVERLGAGGMGEVYKVTHTFLGSTRVVKVIHPQISESEDAHSRFLREARAATRVQHPNVATLHDFSALPDGSHYMVWEYIEGQNLAQRIRRQGTLLPGQAVQLAIEALQGLEAIHRAGIVHRDISPENLMLTTEPGGGERVKVIDLGVAKVEDSADDATRAGVFVGKLRYASPEQLGFLPEGQTLDGRADLYSMAVVLYEMLTGRPPFQATSPHEYVMLHSQDVRFEPLDLPSDLPGGSRLQAVLRRGLERDRSRRYATARDFAAALQEVGRSLPPSSFSPPRPEEDETWRVTPPPQGPPAGETSGGFTLRRGAGNVDPTVRTPLPDQRTGEATGIVARQESSSGGALAVVAGIVILSAVAIAAVLLPKASRRELPAPAPTIPPHSRATARSSIEAQSSLEVVTSATRASNAPPAGIPAASPLTPAVSPSTGTQSPATQDAILQAPLRQSPILPRVSSPSAHDVRNKPAVISPAAREPEAAGQPVVSSSSPVNRVRAYVEGGDSEVNETVLSDFRKQLHGVTRIRLRTSTPEASTELIELLNRDIRTVTVAENSDTVVDFSGTLDRLGRGKKRRSAQATVSRNGRIIFRYEMPPEEYRVGDTPAEAFARVLAEALR